MKLRAVAVLSLVLLALPLLAEQAAEGDMPVANAPDGTALPHGLVASRLRDLARYGLLYTPSWAKAARERVVSAAFVREIQTGGRKEIFMKGEIGAALWIRRQIRQMI